MLQPTPAEREVVERGVREAVDDAADFAERSPFPEAAGALQGVFEDDAITAFTPWWKSHA